MDTRPSSPILRTGLGTRLCPGMYCRRQYTAISYWCKCMYLVLFILVVSIKLVLTLWGKLDWQSRSILFMVDNKETVKIYSDTKDQSLNLGEVRVTPTPMSCRVVVSVWTYCLPHTYTVALFPGLPTVQFLVGEGRPGPFYHVNDVSVYQGTERGRGVPDRKNAFRACILHFEPGAVHGTKAWERGYIYGTHIVLYTSNINTTAWVHTAHTMQQIKCFSTLKMVMRNSQEWKL